MDDYIRDGAVALVIGFLITAGILGYMMTLSPIELEKQAGSIVGGLLFGGFLSLIGFLVFFYGLAKYIVAELDGLAEYIVRELKPRRKKGRIK